LAPPKPKSHLTWEGEELEAPYEQREELCKGWHPSKVLLFPLLHKFSDLFQYQNLKTALY
jgi:hypothetical protein